MNSALYWFLHIIVCILPIVGTSLFFWALVETQNSNGVAVTDISISSTLAAYPNYETLLVILVVAASLISVTTAIRNVQVRIWYRRRYGSYLKSCFTCCCCGCCCKKQSLSSSDGSSSPSGKRLSQGSATCLAFSNDVGSVLNVLAYISFLLLAIYPADDPTEVGRLIHEITSITYFTFATIYGILQVMLTWSQGDHYPTFVRYVQLVLVLGGIVSILVYVITFYGTPDNRIYIAQWIYVTLNLLFVAFFAILFHIDSATDELVEFFCPCCCGGSGGKNKQGIKDQDDEDSYYYRGMP